MTLRKKIEEEILEHGPIPFSRYMEFCLYDPEFGYYSRNAEQFGKAGDFYTSSDVHAVFGRLLARQFDEIWRALDSPGLIEIVELGPGRGLFAQDVLAWSEKKFPDFFKALHYSLIESSPTLRKRLQETLSEHFKLGKVSLGSSVSATITDNSSAVATSSTATTRESTTSVVPPQGPLRAALAAEVSPATLLFANEFFDALPVEILSTEGKLHIGILNSRLTELWSAPSDEEVDFLDRYGVQPEPCERIEVPLAAHACMQQLCSIIQRGLMIIVDYGYTQQEQIAGRHRGTLATFRQHSTSSNPYEAPGEQDITAHVNFNALRAAAEAGGMRVQPLLTQSQFLMGIGEPNQFSDVFEDSRLPQERAKVALQLKHLVTPAGMGENFRVFIASKSIDREKIDALSGLTFANRET